MILYNIKECSISIGIALFMYCLMACHGLIRGKTMIKAMFYFLLLLRSLFDVANGVSMAQLLLYLLLT